MQQQPTRPTPGLQQPKYKIVCSKDDVILKRESHPPDSANSGPSKNTFIIDFEINNSRIDLERFCNFNIFKLMFELNREDAIQELHMTDHDDVNHIKDMLLIFKRRGGDIGIKQKYMSVCLTLNTTTTTDYYDPESESASNFIFECVDLDPMQQPPTPRDIGVIDLSHAERICDIGAVFCMSLLGRTRIRVQFMFSVPAPTKQQPSYIENSLGMVLKKILSRVKTFIEQM
jgi:hypothetical protein